MMIYVDSSSFVKLFLFDRHTEAVESSIFLEDQVIISALTELETLVQIKGKHLGGLHGRSAYRSAVHTVSRILLAKPFLRKSIDAVVFETAFIQHQNASIHCRSLDRLHLAAMAELGVKRLMSHDLRQAQGARELGYEVVTPGVVGWEI